MYTSEVAASYIHTHIKIHTNTCTHTELFSVSVHCRDRGQITLAWHIADHRSRPRRRSTSSPAFSLFSAAVLTYGWIIKQQDIVERVVVRRPVLMNWPSLGWSSAAGGGSRCVCCS